MLLRNFLLTYATDLIILGSNFLSGVILARMLSPGDRGIMALVMTLPMTIVTLVHLGIPQASVYMIGRKNLPPNKVSGVSITLATIIGISAGLALFASRDLVRDRLLGGLDTPYIALVSVLVPFTLVNLALLAIISAGQRFDRYNAQRSISAALQLIGFAAFVWLARGGLSAGILVFFMVILIGTAISALMVSRDFPIRFRFDGPLSGSIIRFGIKSYLQFLFSNLAFRLDLYIIALYLPVEQAAYYSVAVSLAELAWLLPDSAGVVLYPHLTNTPIDEVGKTTAKVLRSVVTLSIATVCVLLLLGRILLPLLYGQPYMQSVAPFSALLPGIVLMSIYKVLARHFTSLGQQKYSIIASGTGLLLIVILDFWLIPVFGILGAAVISTIGYSLSGLLLLILFHRLTGFPLSKCLVLDAGELKAAWLAFSRLLAKMRNKPV